MEKTWMELSHYRWTFSIYRWNFLPFKHGEKHLETMDFPLKNVS